MSLTVYGQQDAVRERRVERRVLGGAAHHLAVVRLAHGQRQARDGHPRAGVGRHPVVLLRVAVPVVILNRSFRHFLFEVIHEYSINAKCCTTRWVGYLMALAPTNHEILAGGLPPETMHSSSISSPAEAVITCKLDKLALL